ncbi:MAG: shikimate kinase [Gallionella sp.]
MERLLEIEGESACRDNSLKTSSGNLILIGMMGSGKTTMGRTLARHLGKNFVDSDQEIQKRTGVNIPYIFDIEGESGFRERETNVLAELVRHNNIVLATGGGAILAEKNRLLLQRTGIVIYLKAAVNDLWHRTHHDKNRPLLQTKDPYGKLTEIYQLRDPIYQQVADIIIQSGKQSVHSLMLTLVAEIERFQHDHEVATKS